MLVRGTADGFINAARERASSICRVSINQCRVCLERFQRCTRILQRV